MSDNPFALSNIDNAEAQRPTTDSNPFALRSIEQDQQKDLRVGVQRAVATNPDQAAEAARLAKRYDLPQEVALRKLPEVSDKARVDDTMELLNGSPIVAQHFRENEFTTKQSGDDVPALAKVEESVGTLKAWHGPEVTFANVAKGLAKSVPQGFEAARLGMQAQMGDFLEYLGITQPDAAYKADQKRKLAQATGASTFTTPDFESSTAQGVYGGAASTLRMIPGLVMSVATRSPTPLLASAGVQSQAEAYAKYRGRGGEAGESFVAATGEGAVEVATEYLGSKYIANALGKTGAGEFLVGLLAREIPGEQAATLLQDAIDTAVANPNKTWEEYLTERPEAAYQTLVATVTQSAIMGGINAGVRRVLSDAQDQDEANVAADQLQASLQAAMQSKLRERNPEQFRSLVQSMAENSEGAPQEVFIDAEVLNQLPEGVLNQLPESVLNQMADALASNDVVSIPVADVLTVAPGTPLEAMLIENARIGDPMAMSQAEAKTAGEQAQQYLAQEAERVIAQANDAQAMQVSSDNVKAGLLDQLNTAARFSPAVNEAYATWTTAFYTTMAGRLGVTPEEMAAKYPLKIGAQAGQGATLEQGAVDMTPGGGAKTIKIGNTTVDYGVSRDGQRMEIVLVKTPPAARGQGSARQALTALLAEADRLGMQVVLTAEPMDKKTSKAKLEAFYKSLGFAPNKGRAKDFTTMAGMVRSPQSLAQKVDQTGTPEFKNWFGESKVVDASGKPLVVYHGTGKDFTEFNTAGGKGKTFGTGAFFSTSTDIAATYATGESPSVYPTYVSLKNPVVIDAGGANWSRIGKKARLDAPPVVVADQDEALMAELEGREPDPTASVKKKKIGTSLGRLFPNEFLYDDGFSTDDLARWARKGGYDGVIFKNVMDHGPSGRFATDEKLSDIYVAFSPTQIKSATGNNGNFDPNDANILKQSVGGFDQAQTPAFKAFSNDAPLVTSEQADTYAFKTGEKIVVEAFHGTKRPDRVGTKFLKKRATSGPMAYHTSSPELASTYATGKQDTSLADEDQDYANWFKFKPQGQRSAVDIVRAWYSLDADTKAKIAETAPKISLDPEGSGSIVVQEDNTSGNGGYDYNLQQTQRGYDRRGNPLKALVEDWLNSGNLFNDEERFVEVLRKAGFPTKDVSYDSSHSEYPFVYKNFIAMQKPLVTSDIPQEVVDELNAAAKKDRSRAKYQNGADAWDKNTKTLKEWVAAFNEPDNQYVWTSLPDKVTDVFRSLGYDGIVDWSGKGGGTQYPVYIPFEETQVKSAIGNKGKFDATKNDILKQDARATFNPETLELVLNENANLSSFLHETGHFFLEVMADLSSQPDAPAEIQQDMAALLKWFGVADMATWNGYTLDQKRQYHERFAESFEQYLLEGKAPSLELQPLFRKFKRWMEHVYTSIKAFIANHPDSGMVLSPEIRQVFDRMLATREQIAQAEEVAGMVPNEDATEAAVEKLTARSLRDLKWTVNARGREIKKLQKQAAELRKGVEAEVRAEVEQMPVYAARKFLRTDTKLAIADLEAIYAGEGDRYALLDWKPLVDQKLAGKEGQHPDIIADMFNFESGDAMVRAILSAEPINSVIEGMTDQRMLERHGDLVDDRAIAEAANEAVHNEARARSLATELKGQADALGARTDTGETNAKGSKITVNALVAAAKQFAANVIAKTPIKDLKSRAWQHVAAERRAGKRWQEATAKGETQAAIKAKQDQVLNNAAAKAATEAQTEMRKILEFFKRVVKDNNEKTVEKGRDPDVVNAARAVLVAYGVAPRAGKSALEYMEVLQKNDPAMFNALQPSVQGALNMAQPLDALTMDELRSLHEEIQGMWYLAKRSRQMEVDGNLMDLEETADLLHERMVEVGIPDEIPGERGSITEAEERGIKLQFAKSILRRVEQWSESLDGKFGGPFLRFVFQPIKAAADRYRTEKVKYRERLTDLVKGIADKMPPGAIVAPELGYTFGNGRDSGTAELLHAILHTGNDSNKRKLLLGRQWASENPDGTINTAQWDLLITRLANEGVLSKEHFDFAQGVWDMLEEMKPLAQKTHREVYGRYFAEITANPVATPFGEYRGGYVPAQTDSRIVKDAKLRELAEGENDSMAYAFPSSPNGFTKGRVEYNQPLLLDLRALGQHMDKVLLFSHMQGAVTDVRRLLTRKNVSYGLNRLDPGAYEGMLIPWLNRAAKQIVETPVAGDRKLSRFLSAARSRAGMALMFANVSNTLQQITGFSLAAVKVKPGLLMKASAQFVAHPKQMRTAVADASEFMKGRMLNEVSAMTDAVEQILVNPTALERGQAWTQQHAYFLQTAMANTMEPIVWTAAYNQAVEQGMDEREAIKFADGTIRQTQGSTLPEDISRFESGPAYGRIFTQFIGYFNMMANTNATAVKQVVDEVGLKKGAGKLLYVALAGMLVPIWVAETIAVAMRGGPEDEDDDGYLDDWLATVFGIGTLRGMVAQVPIVGQAAQLAVNRFNDNPADDKFSLSPAVSLIESTVAAPNSIYKAIVEDGSAMKAVKDSAAAATMITGLPIFAIARPLGYAVGVAEGKVEPTSAGDAVRGAISGTASKESKQP